MVDCNLDSLEGMVDCDLDGLEALGNLEDFELSVFVEHFNDSEVQGEGQGVVSRGIQTVGEHGR